MYQLINCFANLFKIVLQVSIVSSILVTLILIVSKFLKGKLGVKFQYALWFVVILRLLIPTLPESSFSIFNLMSKTKELSYLLTSSKESVLVTAIGYSSEKVSHIYNRDAMLNSLTSINFNGSNAESFQWSTLSILSIIWIIGIVLISFYILLVNIKLTIKIRKQTPFCNKEVTDILEHCKKQMQINKHIPLIRTEEIKSPALFGYVKPIILLPENILDVLPINKLRYIFLHELSHLKRKDILINWIISILRITHWFNPVVQYGLKKMCEEMEICCDSLALSYTNDDEVKEYGLTIISLIERFSNPTKILGTTSIINSKSEVKRRIIMIKLFSKKSYKFSALAVGALLIFGTATLTDAKALVHKNTKAVHVDKIDYSFVNDSNIVGRWQGVDFVDNMNDFKVGTKKWKGTYMLKN